MEGYYALTDEFLPALVLALSRETNDIFLSQSKVEKKTYKQSNWDKNTGNKSNVLILIETITAS